MSAKSQELIQKLLKAEDDATRSSRLRLVSIVRRALADGLETLGIEAPRRM